MTSIALLEYRLISAAAEYLAQRFAHLELPRGADGVILQGVEDRRVVRRKT